MFKGILIGMMMVGTAFGEEPILGDPTEPSFYTMPDRSEESDSASEGKIVLEAVVISESNRVAIINNQIFKVGDLLGDKVIASIEPEGVQLVDRAKKETLLRVYGKKVKEKTQ